MQVIGGVNCSLKGANTYESNNIVNDGIRLCGKIVK